MWRERKKSARGEKPDTNGGSNFPELAGKSSEITFLEEWLEEVRAKRPLSKIEVMEREMETAIGKELYERAAELRDAIRMLRANGRRNLA